MSEKSPLESDDISWDPTDPSSPVFNRNSLKPNTDVDEKVPTVEVASTQLPSDPYDTVEDTLQTYGTKDEMDNVTPEHTPDLLVVDEASEIIIPIQKEEEIYTVQDAQQDFAWVWRRERNQISRPGKQRLQRVREWLAKEVFTEELDDLF